ncbi:MAG: helix-turn-helix transcriptional regulator [Thermoclostridium sp.]|nr:helix-turn-helix transcriptional regulator [Thermoclostridium sp.]
MIEALNGIHETVDYRGDFKVRVHLNKENEDYPQHWHTDTEIIMPIENSYKAVIDENTYHLNVNDIIIVPPCEMHRILAPSTGKRIIVQFDCTMLYSLNGFSSVFHMFHPCVTVTPALMPEIHHELSSLLHEIKTEYFSTLPLREAAVYSLLIRFFTILGRNCIHGNDKFSDLKSQKHLQYVNLFFNVCNYINEHCAENIKLDDIASTAGFSKFHFTRLFKQIMNISCYDYLINRRLMEAEKLLVQPELSIMQVAMKSGFSSLATFNRLFKTKKHCTPTEYRAYLRNTPMLTDKTN